MGSEQPSWGCVLLGPEWCLAGLSGHGHNVDNRFHRPRRKALVLGGWAHLSRTQGHVWMGPMTRMSEHGWIVCAQGCWESGK